MIDRFSEDIDLVIVRRYGESGNKLKSNLKMVSKTVGDVLPEVEMAEITNKKSMIRKTAHTCNKEFVGNYGQVRDIIVLEFSLLGNHKPYLNSFIGEMMIDNRQKDISEANGLLPFEANVLEPIRTMCEKIMSLVHFSYSENPMDDLKRKIRHTYDLHKLLSQKIFLDFFNSPEFDTMLLKIANDDVLGFKSNNNCLANHPSQELIFKDLENVWGQLAPIYNGEYKHLVYGTLTKDSSVLETLRMIH